MTMARYRTVSMARYRTVSMTRYRTVTMARYRTVTTRFGLTPSAPRASPVTRIR